MTPTPSLTYAQQLAQLQSFIETEEAPSADAVEALFVGRDGTAPRLDVYRHAYRARLTEALRVNHPVLHRVLGDEAFATLAADYVAAHPSHRPSIRWFGHRLADWAARHEALPHPGLVDLARMEWALGTAFDSADAAPLDPAVLGRVRPDDWPALRLRPHPSVQCLALDWAVEPLWRTLTDQPDAETDPPQPLRHDLLIWRRGLDTRWRSVSPLEARWIRGLLAGHTLSELLAPDPQPEATDEVSTCIDPATEFTDRLHQWLAEGWLTPLNPPCDRSSPDLRVPD
jgi:hypothetical protein